MDWKFLVGTGLKGTWHLMRMLSRTVGKLPIFGKIQIAT